MLSKFPTLLVSCPLSPNRLLTAAHPSASFKGAAHLAMATVSASLSKTEEVYFQARERGLQGLVEADSPALPVVPIFTAELDVSLLGHGALAKALAKHQEFKAKSGQFLILPDSQGAVSKVLLGLDSPTDVWGYAAIAKLPEGTYTLQLPAPTTPASSASCTSSSTPGSSTIPLNVTANEIADKAALGFLLGLYEFRRYKRVDPKEPMPVKPKLAWPEGANRQIGSLAAAMYFARDIITTPAEDLGPQHLCAEATALAQHHGGSINIIQGDALLENNFPAIHTVGRASYRPPALIDLRWLPKGLSAAEADALPRLSLVGKGVCFDSGGLDIKTAAGMLHMKMDMGGAAFVLALSHVIMSYGLPVRLRTLVPTVENSISGNAYRPLDVLATRSGMTVENGNTDAEGRLILSDALFEAASEKPDLLVDAATLTGAARVALGPEIPGVFSSDDGVWEELRAASEAEGDYLWRLPLHKPYRKFLDSKVADIGSTGGEGKGGAIVAALFLSEFTKEAPRWIHMDTPAWTGGSLSSAGRPEGGEASGLRAFWRMLLQRYGGPKV